MPVIISWKSLIALHWQWSAVISYISDLDKPGCRLKRYWCQFILKSLLVILHIFPLRYMSSKDMTDMILHHHVLVSDNSLLLQERCHDMRLISSCWPIKLQITQLKCMDEGFNTMLQGHSHKLPILSGNNGQWNIN